MKPVIRSISVVELNRRFAAGEETVLLDVRAPAEFATAHVPGARNIPLGAPDFDAGLRQAGGDDATIFVICEAGGRSRACCEKLAVTGGNAVSVEGGTAAWRQAGYPIETSPGARHVISIERQVRIAAGLLVVTGCALGWTWHPGFFAIAAVIGAGLVFAGVTDFCGMGLLLARMPWNRG